MRQRKPVLLVGFNKCGTTSFAEFFRKSGYNCLDFDFIDGHGNLLNGAEVIFDNLQTGKDPFASLEDFDAFTDMEFVSQTQIIEIREYFRDIASARPDCFFILNTRDKNNWLRSRSSHNNGTYIDRYRKFWNIDDEKIIAEWSRQWDKHHLDVRAELPAERLFEFNTDNPDMAGLCQFLGVPLQSRFPQKNITSKGKMSLMLQKLMPKWAKKLVPDNIRYHLKKL